MHKEKKRPNSIKLKMNQKKKSILRGKENKIYSFFGQISNRNEELIIIMKKKIFGDAVNIP